MRGAEAVVDVEAVGRAADALHLGAQLVEHVGRHLVGRAMGRVDHQLQVAQGEVVGEGALAELDVAAGRYIEFCKSTFSNDLTLRDLKLVVDAAHGAAYQVAPDVFHELGAEVQSIGCTPDGLNINDGFGATHPEACLLYTSPSPRD